MDPLEDASETICNQWCHRVRGFELENHRTVTTQDRKDLLNAVVALYIQRAAYEHDPYRTVREALILVEELQGQMMAGIPKTVIETRLRPQ